MGFSQNLNAETLYEARDISVEAKNEAVQAKNDAIQAKEDAQAILETIDNIDDIGILNASAGVATIESGTVTLTATPPTGWINGQSVTVQTVGNIGFAGVNFTSGTTLNLGDKLRKRDTQWELLKFSVNTSTVSRGAISLESDLQRFERTPFFSTGVRADIQQFLVDVQFSGLSLSESDVIHVFQISRNVAGNWFFSIGVNATSTSGRICQYNTSINPETTADSAGNIYQIVTLSELNSSGVTAKAVINWSAITAGVDNYFSSSTSWKNATLNKGFILRKLLDETNKSIVNTNTNVTDNTSRLVTLEKSTLFQGKSLNNSVNNFLLDIQFFGLSIGSSDIVHVYNITRNAVSGSDRKWTFSIGINSTDNSGRICQYNALNITEPTADAKGNRIQTISLTALNSSGVTATATVNWSAITDESDSYWSSSNTWTQVSFNNKAISKRILGDNITALINTNVNVTDNTNRILTLESTDLFKGKSLNNSVNNFLLDIQFYGLSIGSSDIVHVFNIARNAISGSDRKWTFSIGINAVDTTGRICQYNALNITEPTADAKGNRIQTISLTALNSSGVTATATVNWSAITDSTDNYWSNSTAWVQSTFNNRAISKSILGKTITDLTALQADVVLKGNEIVATQNNAVLLNNLVDAKIRNFVLDIAFEGNNISCPSGQYVHIYQVWRSYNNPTTPRWVIDLALNGIRFSQFLQDSYVEPTADANGKIIDIVQLVAFSGSGITAKMKVDWSALSVGERLFYSSSPNYYKSAISPNMFNQTLVVLPTVTKATLPSITIPNRIYTVLEDVSDRNLIAFNARILQDEARNYSLSLYVDKFLKAFGLNTDVRFDATGTDKFRLSSPRLNDNDVATDHATPSQTANKSVVINGGTNYNNKTVSVPHYSTRESTNPDFLTKALFFGDSTIEGLQKEIGVPTGFGCISWSVVHEQFKKCQIDYWLKNGVSISDIQNDTVSSTYKDKYRYIGVGTRNGFYADNYSVNYRGVNKSFTVSAEGRGGWNINSYLNKPTLMVRSQGTWDILGLGNGTGTDYTGSASQIELYDRTAFNSNNILDTAPMRAWFLANLSYTGSTLADYKTRGQTLADNPVNPFYDDAKSSTVTDSLSQTWQVKYSITKYLSRYRTIDNAGVRLGNSDSAKGTLVTDTSLYDVTLPNFIVMQSCQNDGNVAHFGRLTKAMADAIRAEYSANSYGTVNVGISIIDGAGTYFPKLYPYISDFCSIDEFQRNCHNDNLGRAITELSGIEDTNRTFVLSHTHIIPTAKSIIWRNGNSPEFDLTGDLQDTFNIASRTSLGIKAHINAIGNRPIGIHTYAWIKYVLGL